jgi:hypothetical protein
METSPTYPQYFRKDGRCIKRVSATTGTEIRTPDKLENILPLNMSEVTYPTKDRFDDDIKNMEEVDAEMYKQYIYAWLRGSRFIEAEMTKRAIEEQLAGISKRKIS